MPNFWLKSSKAPWEMDLSELLTFWTAVDDLVLLIRMLQDALAAEHFLVVQTVELNFLRWMLLAVLYRAMFE